MSEKNKSWKDDVLKQVRYSQEIITSISLRTIIKVSLSLMFLPDWLETPTVGGELGKDMVYFEWRDGQRMFHLYFYGDDILWQYSDAFKTDHATFKFEDSFPRALLLVIDKFLKPKPKETQATWDFFEEEENP